MMKKGTGLFENSLIWFGAALSIAEILTGTAFAPLGFHRGLAAILLGHLIGGMLLFLAGLMGAQLRKSAMDCANLFVWLAGFLLYRVLMGIDFVLGSTLPDMLITMLLCIAVNKLKRSNL